jgi:dipeptidyl-peptidase-4
MVYAGPGHNAVTSSPAQYLRHQWIADQGFIVVSIDGRGTEGRGRAWERAIAGNFIDLPLTDQVDGLAAVAARVPQMDMERVGVYGWSFGGYFAAMAVMRRPDVFRAAVAGAPVVDWRDYDTHYTERYLGLPSENEDGYERSSVLSYAARLERPLFLVHGTVDDNVYFLHALKLSQALFHAGRAHRFLPLSGATHMLASPEATKRLYEQIVDFFHEHIGTPVGSAQ